MSEEKKLKTGKKKAIPSWKTLIKKRRAVLQQYQHRYYSQVETMRKMHEKIQSSGGYLDQMYAFLDAKSALDWLDMANHMQYIHTWRDESFPCSWIAQMLKCQLKRMGHLQTPFLEVISIGCGTAQKECRIIEILLEMMKGILGIPFYLFDINSLLLECGTKYVENLFQDDPRVASMSMLGNMYDLNLYKEIFYTKEQQKFPRVLMFLGSTLGNINDELDLLRDSFGRFPPGTLLVMDYTLAFGSTYDPSTILEREPYFSKAFPLKYVKGLERFSVGPIQRYKEEKIKKIELRPSLETSRARIAGSYHIELNIDITLSKGEKQSFGIQRIKRYDSDNLLDAIEATGWQMVAGNRFSSGREVYIFCKQ